MPLDITPTPSATPSGAAAPTPAGASAPGLAALFGLLLAQTVGQSVPAAGAPVKTTTAATAQALLMGNVTDAHASTVLSTMTVKADPTKADPTKAGPLDGKVKGRGKTATEATPWPLLPPATTILVPNETTAPVTAQTHRNAMDTDPHTGGELPSVSEPVSVLVSATTAPPIATADVIIPSEPSVAPEASAFRPAEANTTLAAQVNTIIPTETASVVPTGTETTPVMIPSPTPQTPAVPDVILQPAQEVMLAATPRPLSAQTAKPVGAPSGPRTSGLRPASSAPAPITPKALQNAVPPADNVSGEGTGKSTSLNAGADATDTTVTVANRATTTTDKADAGQKAPKTGAEGASATTPTPVPTVSVPKPAEAARAAVAPMPTTDRAQMLKQVSDGLQTMAVRAGGSGQRQVTLQLHPKDWGQVNVSVTMTPTTQADGKASTQVVAHIVADQPAVKEALETHQADLRQTLKDAGLNLDKLTVTVRPAEGGAQAGLGEGRRESRGGEGNPFDSQTGASAQGGAPGSGGGSSAFAAFGQGSQSGQGRQTPTPYAVPVTPDTAAEPDDAPIPTLMMSRVDTRA